MDTFKSDEVIIENSINTIFEKLSSPQRFQELKEKLPDAIKEKMEKVSFGADYIAFEAAPVGEVKLAITEKVAPSRIVFAATQSPIPLQAIINLAKVDEYKTKATAEIAVDNIPVFLRPMITKPLTEAAKKFGDLLKVLPFNIM